MKVLFLDVDGVLSPLSAPGLNAGCLDRLASLVHHTGAQIVLSSTWRHPLCREQRMRLQQELARRGLQLEDMTPVIEKASRADEIAAWLDEQRQRGCMPDAFAILDDDPQGELARYASHLVKCDGRYGLTDEHAAECVRLLTHAQPGGPRAVFLSQVAATVQRGLLTGLLCQCGQYQPDFVTTAHAEQFRTECCGALYQRMSGGGALQTLSLVAAPGFKEVPA